MVSGLDLISLGEHSPTLDIVSRWARNEELSMSLSPMEVSPVLELPESYDVFLGGLSRKKRHELKRKLRRAEGITDRSLISGDRDLLPQDIDDFIRLHYNCGGGKDIFWEKQGMEIFFKSLFMKLAVKGWARMDSLFSGSKLAASLLSFEYGDDLSLYNIAYSEEFRSFSPGYTLFNQAIERAFEKDLSRVDFLRGSEKYKYDFGAVDRNIVRLSLNLKGKAE